MRELVLLGAGASVEAGIPTAIEMSSKMLDRFQADDRTKRFARVLQFVMGGLMMHSATRGNHQQLGINIEDILTTIDNLANRDLSELAPFVGVWHPFVESLERPRVSPSASVMGLTNINYDLDFAVRNSRSSDIRDIAEAVQRLARYAASQIPRPIFQTTSEAMISALYDFAWLERADNLDYLRPLCEYCARNSVTIATLNFDNAIELCAATGELQADIGIDAWHRLGKFDFQTNKVRLLKLHGSIDWSIKFDRGDGQVDPFQIQVNAREAVEKWPPIRPLLLFGGKNKLTDAGPFLDLLAALRAQLDECIILTVIGYSFGDEHINQTIGRWMAKDVRRKIRIVNGPSFQFGEQWRVQLGGRMWTDPDRVLNTRSIASEGIRALYG